MTPNSLDGDQGALFDLDWGACGEFAAPTWYGKGHTLETTALAALLSLRTALRPAFDAIYMAWLMSHKDAFRSLVRDRLGGTAASRILWSAPRLICVAAGDFTRYDVHAVREHRRSIDPVRHRYFGSAHFGLEAVGSVTGHSAEATRVRRRVAGASPARHQGGAMACRRLRNFACLIPPQRTKVLVYLKADPTAVDLAPAETATAYQRIATTFNEHSGKVFRVREVCPPASPRSTSLAPAWDDSSARDSSGDGARRSTRQPPSPAGETGVTGSTSPRQRPRRRYRNR